MQNLIALIIRYGAFITFIIFECICFYMVVNVNSNQKHREIYLNSSNLLSGQVYKQYDDLVKFWQLSEIADSVSQVNAELKTELRRSQIARLAKTDTVQIDSVTSFIFTSAEVKNNSINKRNNTITIDKGLADGIEAGMGVIDDNGVVGIVKNCSPNFCVVLSLLNSNTQISASIKRNNYFGSIRWRNFNATKVTMEDVPKHADLILGDSVITSGFSSIFPEGILIGVIENSELKGGSNFYNITVKLNNNLGNLRYVYVIQNLLKEEQLNLEELSKDE
ncbi:MAG: rod shape-determining protein MreC [Bacteroidota bacterium]